MTEMLTQFDMKVCADHGGDPIPLTDFPPHGKRIDGRGTVCRACIEEGKRKARQRVLLEGKECCACGFTYPAWMFNQGSSNRDGFHPYCYDCERERYNRYRREKMLAAGLPDPGPVKSSSWWDPEPRTDAEFREEMQRRRARNERRSCELCSEPLGKWRPASDVLCGGCETKARDAMGRTG